MSAHATLAPSHAGVWANCAGVIAMLAQLPPEEDSEAAREGTAAHWAAERILRDVTCQPVGELAPNGVEVTQQMFDAAWIYALVIFELGMPLSELHIEEAVMMPKIHEQCWGTPDCWWFDTRQGRLHVWDFKYGLLRVNAFENWQMVLYVHGILESLGLEMGTPVTVNIVQPRCYDGRDSVQQWCFMAEDMRAQLNILREAAHRAMEPGAACVAGDWCRYCPARAVCDAHQKQAAWMMGQVGDAVPQDMSDGALAYELAQVKQAQRLLKGREDALAALAEHRLREGAQLKGWGMQPRLGHNKWLVDDEDVIAMGEMLGVSLLDNPRPLAPTKAAAKLKQNKVDAAVISELYNRPTTSTKLTELDGSEAHHAFTKGVM